MTFPTEEQVEQFARDLASRVGYTWGSSGFDQEEWIANCHAALVAAQPRMTITEQLAEALRESLEYQNDDTECLAGDAHAGSSFDDQEREECPDRRCVEHGCMVARVNRWRAALANYEASKNPRPEPEEWR